MFIEKLNLEVSTQTFVLFALFIVLVIFSIYRVFFLKDDKSTYAGPISSSYERRSNFTSQPRMYRMPGYMRDAAHEIVPSNYDITSTNPYWSYKDDDDYILAIGGSPKNFVNRHDYNYIPDTR
jgi:hypothetical protein